MKKSSRFLGKRILKGTMAMALMSSLTLFNIGHIAKAASPNVSGSTSVSSSSLQCKGNATVTMNLTGQAGITQHPVDVELVLDKSGSMEGSMQDLQNAATNFVDTIDRESDGTKDGVIGNGNKVGVVSFDSYAYEEESLSNKVSDIKHAINSISVETNDHIWNTNHQEAFNKAHDKLADLNDGYKKIIIMFTDGQSTVWTNHINPPFNYTEASNQAKNAAEQARNAGIEIYSIGLGADLNKNNLDNWSADPTKVFITPSSSTLSDEFNKIASAISTSTPAATNISIKGKVNGNFSVNNPSLSVFTGNDFEWKIPELNSENATLRFTLSHIGNQDGQFNVFDSINYTDDEGHQVSLGNPTVTVTGCKHKSQISMPDFSGDYNDATNVSATLTEQDGTPIANQPVTFTLNEKESAKGTTDSNGVATVSLTPHEAAGAYPLTVSYCGDDLELPSNAQSTFTVQKEETTLDITSPSKMEKGHEQLQAVLKEDGETPIAGRSVTFTVGSQTAAGTTDENGVVNVNIDLPLGEYKVNANFNGDDYYRTSQAAQTLVVYQNTKISMSDFSGEYHDATNVSATLTGEDGTPIANQPVTFTLNGQETAQGMTDSNGMATVSLTPNEAAGVYSLNASYAGDEFDLPSNAQSKFTVQKEETTLNIISSSTLPTGDVQLQAVLKEDGETALAGRSVTFTVGSQTVTGTTDANGVVTVSVNLPPGQYTVDANFNGDDYYQPSQSTSQTLYVYQPTNFVIWGGNKPSLADINVGQDYTFWGAKWAAQVKAGDFTANPSFKGYADQSNGSQWSSRPGNSSNPPAAIANYIGVIVTTSSTKTGSVESGNVAELVVLKVDNPSSYQPNPGHQATGTMVSVIK